MVHYKCKPTCFAILSNFLLPKDAVLTILFLGKLLNKMICYFINFEYTSFYTINNKAGLCRRYIITNGWLTKTKAEIEGWWR